MTGQLNTTVNGSPGTCEECADWLDTIKVAGFAAGDNVNAAYTATSNWHGPASEAYVRSMDGVRDVCDDLGFTAREYQRALREFATALKRVFDRMDDALSKARVSGLEVEGGFIVPPRPLGLPPAPPNGVMTPDQAQAAVAKYEAKQNAYAADVDEYNRKAQAFNECSEIVTDARNKEDEAHANLRATLSLPERAKLDGFKIGSQSLGTLLAFVETAENERFDALRNAKRLANQGKTFQQFADGTLTKISAAESELLKAAGNKAGPGATQYLQRAYQYESMIKAIPEGVRTRIAAYPGRNVDADAPRWKQSAARMGKMFPYASSAVTAFSELRGAWKGEQTWERAVGKTLTDSGRAWAGGQAGARVGSRFGPWGVVIGSVAGGLVATVGGDEVVDFLNGENQPQQPTARVIDYTPDDRFSSEGITIDPDANRSGG